MAFEPKLLDKPLTPIEALEWRSELVRYVKTHVSELTMALYHHHVANMEKRTGARPQEDEIRKLIPDYKLLAEQLAEAELLLWDKSMVDFAVAGQKFFYDLCVSDDIPLRQPEIWLYNYNISSHRMFPMFPQLQLIWPYQEVPTLEVSAFMLSPSESFTVPIIVPSCHVTPGDVYPKPNGVLKHSEGQSVIVAAQIEFLKSTIVISEKESLPRRIRRQAEREIKHEPIVRVIRLRRKEHGQGSGSGGSVDWQNQWLVRPHWRNQYHPSTGERKPIFIDAYIKGPEDKPFKPPKDYVFKVDR